MPPVALFDVDDGHAVRGILQWIAFSRGVSEPGEPAISVRDPTGAITTWIDIGAPDAGRLHKASKAARRVVVYTHKDPRQFLNQLAGEKSRPAKSHILNG